MHHAKNLFLCMSRLAAVSHQMRWSYEPWVGDFYYAKKSCQLHIRCFFLFILSFETFTHCKEEYGEHPIWLGMSKNGSYFYAGVFWNSNAKKRLLLNDYINKSTYWAIGRRRFVVAPQEVQLDGNFWKSSTVISRNQPKRPDVTGGRLVDIK